MNGMECLISCEQRIDKHYQDVTRINAEDWKTAPPTRGLSTVIAQALVALALRLDATAAMKRAVGGHVVATARRSV